MKKIMILSIVAMMGLILPSCKKDYTCTCVVEKQQYIYNYDKETKGEAQKSCDGLRTSALISDSTATCALSKTVD